MSRVEQIGDCTLYLADCEDVLPALGKVGAIIADPRMAMLTNHQDTEASIVNHLSATSAPNICFMVIRETWILTQGHFLN